jgi:CRP-like cAMP-binding protein
MRGRVTSVFYVARDVFFMIGMGSAALADFVDVRLLVLIEALLLIGVGALTLVMPGLGRPAAEWRRAISLLRTASAAPGLEAGRAATLADFDRLVGHLSLMSALSTEKRRQLTAQAHVCEAPAGTTIIRKGEVSDAAYFLLDGRTFAGWEEDGHYRMLEVHNALTSMPRTAHVIAEEDTTLLRVPATVLREMSGEPVLNRLFLSKMTERMVRMDLLDIPRMMERDQELLRDLRSPEPQTP